MITSPNDTVSPQVAAKARRLIAERLVAHGPGPLGGDYRVKGSTLYRVSIHDRSQYPTRVDADCSCPARRTCAHILAAVAFAEAKGDPRSPQVDRPDGFDPFDIR